MQPVLLLIYTSMVFATSAATLFARASFVISCNHYILLLVHLFPGRIKNKAPCRPTSLLFQWLVKLAAIYTIQDYSPIINSSIYPPNKYFNPSGSLRSVMVIWFNMLTLWYSARFLVVILLKVKFWSSFAVFLNWELLHS